MMPLRILFGLLIATATSAAQAAVVHTANFIDDAERGAFAGFESLPDGTALPPLYNEDGILVTQIGGDGDDIWSTCSPCWDSLVDGDRSWYPFLGDAGYTRITLAAGGDFTDVGFFVSSGFAGNDFPNLFLYFELWDDGAPVQSGELAHGNEAVGTLYLGFSAGGFDEIRVRDSLFGGAQLLDGSVNALAIDSIELRAIPLPGALGLFVAGLASAGLLRGRLALL